MIKIDQLEVENKFVMVRTDFNVPLTKEGKIADDLRLRQALPTMNFLLEKGAKVIIISHFRDPSEERRMGEKTSIWKRIFSWRKKEGSLSVVRNRFSELLGKKVHFVPDCIGEKVKRKRDAMNPGEVLLLENVRMYKEEKEGLEEFAKELASLADIYVNDAFSVSHRAHASVMCLPKLLPSAAGILMEKEMRVLDRVRKGEERPVVAIIGGAKIESKITAIRYFLENADHVLLGGKIANTILIVNNIASNSPWPDEEIVEVVRGIDITSPKAHLPVDVMASSDETGEDYIRDTAPGSVRKKEEIYDIGSETRRIYREIIREAGTVIWAGPLGLFEQNGFDKGTREIAQEIADNRGALKIAGGGDTSRALSFFGFSDKMDHISCGGGAMLAYLSGSPMPGIENLS